MTGAKRQIPNQRIHRREKETTMQFKLMTTIFAPVVALTLSAGAASVSADSERNGHFLAVKDCAKTFTGDPGSYCAFTSSNVPDIIPIHSKLFYDQGVGSLPGAREPVLDSNVIFDAGNGNRARGRCTLDLTTFLGGLCTFSDGIGDFAGFYARVTVNCPNFLTYFLCSLDGTYSFREEEQ
jgi:hypothetical protein